jgi:hypothetical protein
MNGPLRGRTPSASDVARLLRYSSLHLRFFSKYLRRKVGQQPAYLIELPKLGVCLMLVSSIVQKVVVPSFRTSLFWLPLGFRRALDGR